MVFDNIISNTVRYREVAIATNSHSHTNYNTINVMPDISRSLL